jgi:endonuclease-3
MAAPRAGSRAHIREIVARLGELHGAFPWRRRHPPVDELVTTLLSHSTTDANQHRAFEALTTRFPDWDAVRAAPADEVIATVRVAGLANQKGPRIQGALDVVAADPRGADLEWLGGLSVEEGMAYLTAIPGVGVKTAACVLCFSFDHHIVPADTHVHRIALRTRMVPPRTDARRTQERLTRALEPGEAFSAHMRLIAHGRTICTARSPRCGECPVLDLCPWGRGLSRRAGR